MKTRLVRIGNSRGVRIPKPLLEQAGLEDEVQLRVVDDGSCLRRHVPHGLAGRMQPSWCASGGRTDS